MFGLYTATDGSPLSVAHSEAEIAAGCACQGPTQCTRQGQSHTRTQWSRQSSRASLLHTVRCRNPLIRICAYTNMQTMNQPTTHVWTPSLPHTNHPTNQPHTHKEAKFHRRSLSVQPSSAPHVQLLSLSNSAARASASGCIGDRTSTSRQAFNAFLNLAKR